jgi:hypothetical protein
VIISTFSGSSVLHSHPLAADKKENEMRRSVMSRFFSVPFRRFVVTEELRFFLLSFGVTIQMMIILAKRSNFGAGLVSNFVANSDDVLMLPRNARPLLSQLHPAQQNKDVKYN